MGFTDRRTVLMCRPDWRRPIPAERLWRDNAGPLDTGRLREEWEALRELVDRHVGPVLEIRTEPWAIGMCFVRDLAVTAGGRVVPLMPTLHRGPFEAPLFRRELERAGVSVTRPDRPLPLDGGNVVTDHQGRLLVGVHGEPSDELRTTVRELESITGAPAVAVPLRVDHFPHLDMVLADLAGRGWLAHAEQLPGLVAKSPAWQEFLGGQPLVETGSEDGDRLACNLVVGREAVVGPAVSHRLRSAVERLGLEFVPTPLDEWRKLGSGAHCLTLELTL